MDDDLRRRIPSVSDLLHTSALATLIDTYGHQSVVKATRETLDQLRTDPDTIDIPPPDVIATRVQDRLRASGRRRVQPVINATGVVLHTNLGRATLSESAIDAVVHASGACTVEFDLASQQRSSRGDHARRLLRELVGAEDALVVNNGAAALLLALTVVAAGRRVAVSRGELVEIGGSFRLPSIIQAAGVGLTEVGTTNRTRTDDYVRAIRADSDVVAILRVHPSNFRIEGFTHSPAAAELSAAATEHDVPLVYDVGSGLLHDDLPLPTGSVTEPSIATAIADGADLVIASGDKLLGGPQAGLLVGTRDLVQQCRQQPLARALRIDKLRLAALEATLETYQRGQYKDLPVWIMLQTSREALRERADSLREAARTAGVAAEVVEVDGVVGGGSMPGATIPSIGLAMEDPDGDLANRLAANDPPIVARTQKNRLLLDLRTVSPAHDATIISAIT